MDLGMPGRPQQRTAGIVGWLESKMKFVMAFLALLLVGWTAAPVLAAPPGAPPPAAPLANDPLSIENNNKYLEDNKKQKGWIVRPSGLQFRILQNGYGKRPQLTDTVKVYYTGKLINGTI